MLNLEIFIGQSVIGLAVLTGFIWIVVHSPLISWIFKNLLILAWGVATLGTVLFVVIVIDIPKHHYGEAVVAMIVGAFMYVPWFVVGVPLLWSNCKKQNWDFRLWE